MAKTDDTRDAHASTNTTNGIHLVTGAHDKRAVLTEDGQPTGMTVLTLEEAEALAKAQAKRDKSKIKGFAATKRGTKAKSKAKPRPEPIAKPKQRKINVKPERFFTVTECAGMSKHTPWIRLRGRWLIEAGFPVRCLIRVRIKKGRLIITADGMSE